MMDTYLAYAARGRNDWWRYLLTPILGFLLTALVLIVLTLVLMFAHLLPPGFAAQMQHPKNIVPFYLGIAAWTQFTFHFRQRLALDLGESVVHDLRNDIFLHLQRMNVGFFHRVKLGRIISRMTSRVAKSYSRYCSAPANVVRRRGVHPLRSSKSSR